MAEGGIKLTVLGTKEILRKLQEAGPRAYKAIGAGLYAEGNNIMADSKPKVPVDRGTLKGSGYVTLPELSDTNVRVEIGYGGWAAPYAVVQHEHTEYSHPEGGEAKFLEKPMNEHSGSFQRNVAYFAAQAFERGVGAEKSDMIDDPWKGPKPGGGG